MFALRSRRGFHAEWLRDEPSDATATDPRSYIAGDRCQLSPGNREHEIRHASWQLHSVASFPYSWKKRPSYFRTPFPGSSPATREMKKASSKMAHYELRCRECGKTWGNQPRSICDDCFSPLEISYDYDAVRETFTRERIASRAPDMWRYSELLPL